MTEQQRRKWGIVGVVAGSAMLVVGVLVAHFTGLPELDSIGREIHPSIPRCAPFENNPESCWMLPTAGQGIAVLGSQIMMLGIVFGWIWDRKLTWALASVGAFLFTLEMIILFGIIPNQWLNLTQGTFEWTQQKVAFTIPKWLVLNNDVSISYGAIKDMVSGGYAAGVLGAIAVGAYQYQEWSKKRGEPRPPVFSTYGRPVVKGGE
jgi:hypothetical protein